MMYDYKQSVEYELDKVMTENGLVSPLHQSNDDHNQAAMFKGFVEMVVYNSIIDYLKRKNPEFADEGEANYYEDELFPDIYATKVNDKIDLAILHFKYAMISLLKGDYIDIEALAAEPFNIKYAVAIKLVNLGLITDKRTINKIKSGDVSLNIITRILHQESIVDEVCLRDCLSKLKYLASFTK